MIIDVPIKTVSSEITSQVDEALEVVKAWWDHTHGQYVLLSEPKDRKEAWKRFENVIAVRKGNLAWRLPLPDSVGGDMFTEVRPIDDERVSVFTWSCWWYVVKLEGGVILSKERTI